MEPTKTASIRTLRLRSATVVIVHFVAAIWHLFLVVKVQAAFPAFAPPLLILVNLIPVASLVAFPLAVALVIGIYAHFLSPGADNIFRMPPGDLRLPFQVCAVLLVVLEALGCWIGIRIFVQTSARRALTS